MEIFRDMISYSGLGEPEDYPSKPIAYKQFALTRNVCVPTPKPDMEVVVKVMSEAFIHDIRLITTPYDKKFIINGKVKQTILYTADVPDQSVHSFHTEVPFCEMIVIDTHCAERYNLDFVDAKIIIEDVHVYHTDKRCLEECKVLVLILEEHQCRHHKKHRHHHDDPEE